jgi:spore cortex formation protein SpoVR/YcgB (stage V sporulation)
MYCKSSARSPNTSIHSYEDYERGWAKNGMHSSFHLYDGVSPRRTCSICAVHAGVVNPGGRFSLNPYYLGYTMLVDIEQRWDQKYAAGEVALTGRQKLFEVRRTEDDLSFLRNYLTPELVQRLHLFAYGSDCTHPPGQQCPQCQTVVITARERDAVVEALLAPRYNYDVPRIVIHDVANNTLCLEHLDRALDVVQVAMPGVRVGDHGDGKARGRPPDRIRHFRHGE